MDLGEIFEMAAKKDLAAPPKKFNIKYKEEVKDGKFEIKLTSIFEEAYVECSIPYSGFEEEKNYLRTYFLSMVFNAAIVGMKRTKDKKKRK